MKVLHLSFIVVVSLSLLVGHYREAKAHSTKGRVKIEMSKDMPTIDDFAYFMEYYIHNHFYRGKFEQAEKRFYVKEFIDINLDTKGRKAVVRFRTLDNKTKKDFEDSMTFQRGDTGSWLFKAEGALTAEPVYTYVSKGEYYLQRYPKPLAVGSGVLGVAALGLMVWQQKRKAAALSAN